MSQTDRHQPLPSPLAVLLIVLGFFAVTFTVYGQSLAQNFVSFDDPYVIVHNLAIRGLDIQHLKAMFSMYDPELYTPLTFLSFAINYAMGGIAPFSYHLLNLLLHTANALLVSWLMLALTKSRPTALLLGLLFAVHPVHTETVVWATARKELLSTFFALASFVLFIDFRERGSQWNYGASIVAFTMGLLSKVTIFTLPVLLLLWEWRERGRVERKTAFLLGPLFLLSVIFGIVGLIPKVAIITSTTLPQKILMMARGTLFYLQKFALPIHLSVLYPNTDPVALTSPVFALSLLLFLLLLILVLLSLRRTREVAFGFGLFFIAIAPTFLHFNRNGSIHSGIVTGIQIASDHYLYLPSIGLLCLLGSSVLWWIRSAVHIPTRDRNILIASVLSLGIIGGFGFLAHEQSLVWAMSESLYLQTLRYYPASSLARVNLSVIYRNTDRPDEEQRVLEEGLTFGPDAKLITGLGTIEARHGNTAEAERLFARAIATDPTDPQPHFSRGAMQGGLKRTDEAMAEYQRALALDPTYVDVLSNMGSIEMQRGNTQRAEEYFRRAVAINPTFAVGYFNLGYLLLSEKRIEEAIATFEHIVEIDENDVDARLELISLYLSTKNPDRALLHLKAILHIDPENPQAKAVLQELVRLGVLGMKR